MNKDEWREILKTLLEVFPDDNRPESTFDYYYNALRIHGFGIVREALTALLAEKTSKDRSIWPLVKIREKINSISETKKAEYDPFEDAPKIPSWLGQWSRMLVEIWWDTGKSFKYDPRREAYKLVKCWKVFEELSEEVGVGEASYINAKWYIERINDYNSELANLVSNQINKELPI